MIMTDESTVDNPAVDQTSDSGMSQTTDSSASNGALTQAVPGYIAQRQVDDIVADARRKALDKGRTDANDSFKQEMAELRTLVEKSGSKSESKGTKTAPTETDLQGMIDSAFTKHSEKARVQQEETQVTQAWQHMANQLTPKLQEAQKNHSDFDETVNQVDYATNAPDVLFLANAVDNSGDVLYDLAKNPGKLANFRAILRETPQLAAREMKRYGDSLKNQNTGSPALPPDPLSQLSPSNIGGSDGGLTSVDDFKQKYTV